jgi:hypothetical protein
LAARTVDVARVGEAFVGILAAEAAARADRVGGVQATNGREACGRRVGEDGR